MWGRSVREGGVGEECEGAREVWGRSVREGGVGEECWGVYV